ncbi:MAG: PaaI family thioesterase [Pseudomonadota bacterium]
MTLQLPEARQTLAAQPFSTLLGAQLVSFGPDRAVIRIAITDQLKQQHGFVHGGVLSYAADNALAFAGGAVLGADVVTSEFKINYLRPALSDGIVARASVIHAGRTQAVCRCEVFFVKDGEEVLCAVAQGTIAALGRAP